MFVILTWSGNSKIYDFGTMRGFDGEVLIFPDIKSANEWVAEQESELCDYYKIVSLEE